MLLCESLIKHRLCLRENSVDMLQTYMLHIWHHWLHLSAALVMYQLFFVFFILFCGKLQTPSWPGVRLWIDVATEKNMSGEKMKAVMLKLKLNQQIQRHVDTYLHRYVCLYLYIYLNATNGSSALMCHTLHSWAFFHSHIHVWNMSV